MQQVKTEEFKLTEEHFNYFTNEVKHFAKLLQLADWNVVTQFAYLEGNPYASAYFNWDGHQATITLNTVWINQPPTDEFLTESAFHETLHVMFGDEEGIAELDADWELRRTLSTREIHKIIRRLENVVLPIIRSDYGKDD